MPRHSLHVVALLGWSLLAPACKVYDPLYCDIDKPCEDPERPFCDLNGEYPASEGIKKTCIPAPDREPGTFAIAIADDEIEVRVGEQLSVPVTITRKETLPGDITLRVDGLPPGTSADPITIPEDADGATLVIEGGEARPGAAATITVTANSTELERKTDLQLLVLGPPGTVDPSFGILGVAAESVPATDDARFVRQLASGALLVGGDANVNRPSAAAFVRFLSDGQLDNKFGDEGWLEFELEDVRAQNQVAFAQQAQRTVMAAVDRDVPDELALGRVDADGRIDTTFAGGGTFLRRLPGAPLTVEFLGVGTGQAIVVGMTSGETREGILFTRFTADGVNDAGFGDKGIFRFDRGTSHTLGRCRFRGNQSFICFGSSVDPEGVRSGFLFRVTAQGVLDSAFGENGVVAFEPNAFPSTMAELEDGRIIVAGSVQSVRTTPVFWRLSPTGELDRSFGVDGELRVSLPEGRSGGIRDLLPVEDGKLLGVGSPGITLLKLDPQIGVLDPFYGINTIQLASGRAMVDFVDVGRGRLVVLADLDSLNFVLSRVFL
jgi:uncharacterized delta-60 repeat protein